MKTTSSSQETIRAAIRTAGNRGTAEDMELTREYAAAMTKLINNTLKKMK